MTQKFNILYNLAAKSGKFTEADLLAYAKDDALCDAYIFMPIRCLPEEDLIFFNLKSLNGSTGLPLSPDLLFKYWAGLGKLIAQDESLPQKQKEVLRWPAECFKFYAEDK